VVIAMGPETLGLTAMARLDVPGVTTRRIHMVALEIPAQAVQAASAAILQTPTDQETPGPQTHTEAQAIPVHKAVQAASEEMTPRIHMDQAIPDPQTHMDPEIMIALIHMGPGTQGRDQERMIPPQASSWRKSAVFSRTTDLLRRDSRSVLKLEVMNMDLLTRILMVHQEDQGIMITATTSWIALYE